MIEMEQIDEFVKSYQIELEIGIIVIAAVLIIFLMIRWSKFAKKKGKVLSELNNAVSEINSTVKVISGKDTVLNMQVDGELERVDGAETTPKGDNVRVGIEDILLGTPKITEDNIESDTDKNGVRYTIDELKEKIKF